MSRVYLPLYYFLQLTWGIVQNVLGLLFCVILFIIDSKRPRGWFNGAYVVSTRLHSSAGVGMFIFMGNVPMKYYRRVLVHEYGHTIQSCILGPFYLLVIGIPSMFWANLPYFRKLRRRKEKRYTSFYPERWANYLGKRYTGEEPIRN